MQQTIFHLINLFTNCSYSEFNKFIDVIFSQEIKAFGREKHYVILNLPSTREQWQRFLTNDFVKSNVRELQARTQYLEFKKNDSISCGISVEFILFDDQVDCIRYADLENIDNLKHYLYHTLHERLKQSILEYRKSQPEALNHSAHHFNIYLSLTQCNQDVLSPDILNGLESILLIELFKQNSDSLSRILFLKKNEQIKRNIELLDTNLENEQIGKKVKVEKIEIPVGEALADFLKEKRDFDYQLDPLSHGPDLGLVVKPVSILSCDEHKNILGVYTTKELEPGTILGEYVGRRVEGEDPSSDSNYLFEIDENILVDASSTGNWTSLVNSPVNARSANVVADVDPNGKKIIYQVSRPILSGQQLLIYYGPNYHYHHIRYLKETDTDKESIDIIHQYNHLYVNSPQSLLPSVAKVFGVSADSLFAIPTFDRTVSVSVLEWSVMPLLQWDASLQTYFPQNVQENMTLLMYACALGHKNRVRKLLDLGVNPNIQTSIGGDTALHIAVRASLRVNDKIKIIKELIAHEVYLESQNIKGNSVFHLAIDLDEAEALSVIKILMKKIAKKKAFLCENNDKLDAFLYALSLQKMNICLYLVDYLSKNRVKIYVSNEYENVFKALLNHIPNSLHEQKKELLRRLKTKFYMKKINDLKTIRSLNALDEKKVFRSESLFFNQSPDQSLKSIVQQEETYSNAILKIEQYVQSNVFNKKGLEDKKNELIEAIQFFVENVYWFKDPYLLKHVRHSVLNLKHRDRQDLIYLSKRDEESHSYEFSCFDLEWKRQSGCIELSINFEKKSKESQLQEVIMAISKTHSVSDEDRQQRISDCLEKAQRYKAQLTNVYGGSMSIDLEQTIEQLSNEHGLMTTKGALCIPNLGS